MLTLTKRVGNAVRLAEVVQVLVKHGFADLVRRASLHNGLPAWLLRRIRLLEAPTGEPATAGQRWRAVLTELGPTFVKLGQILSTRPDIVGNELSAEFSKLQDQVTPIPFAQIEAVVEQELGAKPGALFAEFRQDPVASASLSQVYWARLKTGEPVAVKIQRPGMERTIESDLSLLRRVAEWVAEHVEETAWLDPPGVVDEFERSLRREMDYTIEARIIDRFHENFADSPEVFVPRTYPALSSRRVLTLDWVDGVRVDALDQYPARGCDPRTVARRGAEVLCRQVFEHYFFHADPHPGNVFITRDNQIAFVDYGMVGHLQWADATALANLLRAIYQERGEDCVEAILAISTSAEETGDHEALEHEVADYIAFEGRAIVAGARVGEGIERLVAILRRHHMQLAPRLSLLLKALVTIENVAHVLDPEMNMVPVLKPHVEQLVARRYAPVQLAREAREGMSGLVRLGRQLPKEIEYLLRQLRRGRLRIQLHHEGLDQLAHVTDRASNRIAFGIITGSIIIASSFLVTTGRGSQTLGTVGFIVAGILGLSLAISILHSRNY